MLSSYNRGNFSETNGTSTMVTVEGEGSVVLLDGGLISSADFLSVDQSVTVLHTENGDYQIGKSYDAPITSLNTELEKLKSVVAGLVSGGTTGGGTSGGTTGGGTSGDDDTAAPCFFGYIQLATTTEDVPLSYYNYDLINVSTMKISSSSVVKGSNRWANTTGGYINRALSVVAYPVSNGWGNVTKVVDANGFTITNQYNIGTIDLEIADVGTVAYQVCCSIDSTTFAPSAEFIFTIG